MNLRRLRVLVSLLVLFFVHSIWVAPWSLASRFNFSPQEVAAIVAEWEAHLGSGSSYDYGTAGFRMRAIEMDPLVYRVGLLIALRSKSLAGQAVGVMLTASHNPPEDNGVKLIDPLGEMLAERWEAYANQIVNIAQGNQAAQALQQIVEKESIDLDQVGHVIVGRDTRPTGMMLKDTLISGAKLIPRTEMTDSGVVSTPILHYLVRSTNTLGDPLLDYGQPTESGYFHKLAQSYQRWMVGTSRLESPLFVDAANGVGALTLARFSEVLNEGFNCSIFNTDTQNPVLLNKDCGADFVKTNQRAPALTPCQNPGARFAVFDGDADRLLYFYFGDKGAFHLLDGDKIAALTADYLLRLIQNSGLTLEGEPIRVGVVQTAYTNGANTEFLKNKLKIPVSCVPTGVKYLHREAAHRFDIGIYFEANGHGTVLFNPRVTQRIRDAAAQAQRAFSVNPLVNAGVTESQWKAIQELDSLVDLINQTVGDGLSDLLLVEGILAHRAGGSLGTNQAILDWDHLYADLPNRQLKLAVADKNEFKTTDADRRLVEPLGLQDRIDAELKKFRNSRCFVRASGTENVIRIYAEAESQEELNRLMEGVKNLLDDYL